MNVYDQINRERRGTKILRWTATGLITCGTFLLMVIILLAIIATNAR